MEAGQITLPTDALRPNAYNPNTLTPDELRELVAEVRHLGRLPKPVVVRAQAEDAYEIVDGEHNWRAAQEVGLAAVPCEVIEADDFEAMRQTYKRNQHGTPNPVALGRMFRRMLEERGLSQRALATEINVSEGTVRNALAYLEAADLRNSYAFEELSLRQVRAYLELPEGWRDTWLEDGAELLRVERVREQAKSLERALIHQKSLPGEAAVEEAKAHGKPSPADLVRKAAIREPHGGTARGVERPEPEDDPEAERRKALGWLGEDLRLFRNEVIGHRSWLEDQAREWETEPLSELWEHADGAALELRSRVERLIEAVEKLRAA